jgi:hypothetical protein
MAPKNILIILSSHRQKKPFKNLSSLHQLHFGVVNKKNSLFKEFQRINTNIQKKQLEPDSVFGVTDRSSIIASLFAEKYNLVGPKPKSIAKLQHKGVFLQLLNKLGYDYQFILCTNNKNLKVPFSFPVFYKPVKAFLSVDSGIAQSKKELQKKLSEVFNSKRKYVDWFKPFFAQQLNNAPPTKSIIIQKLIQGKQYTADGFVCNNKIYITAITKSVMHPQFNSFQRFEFPAEINQQHKKKLKKIITSLTTTVDYNYAFFNVEFFISNNQIVLIEFNTRLSSQFLPLFKQKYADSYLKFLIDLSLGNKPLLKDKQHQNSASCCILRKKQNLFVKKTPSEKELKNLKNKYPQIIKVKVFAKENHLLSATLQDSYSFRYAELNIKGKDQQEVRQSYQEIEEKLKSLFVFKPT